MLLELIFNILLNNVTHARTDARTQDIASPWAPVGAKNIKLNISFSQLALAKIIKPSKKEKELSNVEYL